MNADQTRALLIKASTIDNRVVSPLAVESWAEILEPVAFEDALAALRQHRADHPGVYVEPGHIIQGARRIRDRRDRVEEGREQRALTAVPDNVVPFDRSKFDEDTAQAAKRTAQAAVKNVNDVLGRMRVPAAERADADARRAAARAELDARRPQQPSTQDLA